MQSHNLRFVEGSLVSHQAFWSSQESDKNILGITLDKLCFRVNKGMTMFKSSPGDTFYK